MPDAVLIAGANGAGKTTFARELVPTLYPVAEFLNVDEVQAQQAEFAHPIAAGRETLRRLAAKEAAIESFVIETTLASTMYARRVALWRASGYHVTLHFIELPSVDFAIQRVAMRVASGGHSVPAADIRRRFRRGIELFQAVYKPIVDQWYHWISDEAGLRLSDHGPI
jgi:predicted ABC-type ATPase